MAIIETNHTEVVLRKLKSDIDGFMTFVRIATMVGFSLWYVYLIVTNFSSIPHLIAYAVMFALVIVTFFAERSFKPTGDDSRKNKRKKVEKHRNFSLTTKIIKYTAKCVTIGLALYASVTNPTSQWDLILDIASAVMLLVSVLCEFITGFINKYIDYLTISIAMDYQNSGAVELYKKIAKFFGDKQLQLDDINNELMLDRGESLYTGQEQQIRDMLTKGATTLREQKAERKKLRQKQIDEQLTTAKAEKKQIKQDKVAATKAEKKSIREEKKKQSKRKLTKAEKNDVTAKFEEKKAQAKQIITLPEKLDELFDKGQMLFDNLPVDVPALKNIPLFLSLINNYASGRYKDVSLSTIIAVVAAVLYFVAPIDVIPETTIPGVGYLDDAFVVDMVLKAVKKELKKFEQWKKTNTPTDNNLPAKK